MTYFLTAALYKFVELSDFADLKAPLLACCNDHKIKGTILLAEEGINGTIAGLPQDVYAVLEFLRRDPRLANLTHKESFSEKPPFYRMKVRLKREIVTMGVPIVLGYRRHPDLGSRNIILASAALVDAGGINTAIDWLKN